MNKGLEESEELVTLEQELLRLEETFAQKNTEDIPVNLKEFVKKSKKYTELRVALAEENGFESGLELGLKEGLDAGLLLQKLKEEQLEKRFPKEESSSKVNSVEETPLEEIVFPPLTPKRRTKILDSEEISERIAESTLEVKEKLTETTLEIKEKLSETTSQIKEKLSETNSQPSSPTQEEKKPKYVRINSQVQIPPPDPILTQWKEMDGEAGGTDLPPVFQGYPPPVSKVGNSLSEVNLGKYVMGILAAILTLTGTVLLASLAWNYVDPFAKTVLFLLVGSVMVYFPFQAISEENYRVKNGFLTSLIGSGLSICYIATVFCAAWNLITSTMLFLLLVLMILFTVFLSYKIQSNTLMVVSYIGTIMTLMILSFTNVSISEMNLAFVSILCTTGFLVVFTLTREWTNAVTRGLSLLFPVSIVMISVSIIDFISYSNQYAKFYDIDSTVFTIFCMLAVFSLLLMTLFGRALSDCSEFELISSDNSFGEAIHFWGLFLTYFLFSDAFGEIPMLMLLLIGGSFLRNKERATPILASFPFVVVFVYEFMDNMKFQSELRYIEELAAYVCYVVIAFVIHLTTKWMESRRCTSACLGYTLVAFLFALVGLKEIHEFVPLFSLLFVLYYDGYEKGQEEHSVEALGKLSMYIPVSFLLATVLHIAGFDSSVEHAVAIILMFSSVQRFYQLFWGSLKDFKGYMLLLKIVGMFSFMTVSSLLYGRHIPVSFQVLASSAILLTIVLQVFLLREESEEFDESLAKPAQMLYILVGFLAISQVTPFGSFAITSSSIILITGGFSIFLGFRWDDKKLREVGLVLSIIAVLKMVIFDVANTDSVIRIVALILGAVLCFLISCVYNKLEE